VCVICSAQMPSPGTRCPVGESTKSPEGASLLTSVCHPSRTSPLRWRGTHTFSRVAVKKVWFWGLLPKPYEGWRRVGCLLRRLGGPEGMRGSVTGYPRQVVHLMIFGDFCCTGQHQEVGSYRYVWVRWQEGPCNGTHIGRRP
jgi:hypothetical protein